MYTYQYIKGGFRGMDKVVKDARLAGRVAIVTGAGSRSSGIGNGRAGRLPLPPGSGKRN